MGGPRSKVPHMYGDRRLLPHLRLTADRQQARKVMPSVTEGDGEGWHPVQGPRSKVGEGWHPESRVQGPGSSGRRRGVASSGNPAASCPQRLASRSVMERGGVWWCQQSGVGWLRAGQMTYSERLGHGLGTILTHLKSAISAVV